ncbi:terpenoid synthase [Diplocarpon rosae]|nr:terpenoid synthase [Diplocarpon rosae]
MRPIFEKYTGDLNPNYQALIPVVNEKLESLEPNQKRLAKLKKADFALFASNWWPHADFDQLRIVTYLAIWLFLWDDVLDEPTGEYADNFEAAQRYRKETVQFLADTLGLSISKEISTVVTYSLSDYVKLLARQLKSTLEYVLALHPSENDSMKRGGFMAGLKNLARQLESAVRWGLRLKPTKKSPPTASHPIIEGFRVIGEELKTAYTVEQRQNFFEDLKFYISTTETEQRFHLDGKLPTLKEYWEVRMGTSAVAACLAMIEFTNKIKGPYQSTNHPLLKTLSDEANIIVVMQVKPQHSANDMLSLKKEIVSTSVSQQLRVCDAKMSKVQGCLDSLIPLSVPVYGGVQQAIDQAHTDLLAAVDRFDAEAKKLLSGPNTTDFSDRELRIFVNGCRDCWVGNFNWSLCTGRYGLGDIDQKSGSFHLSL